MQTTFTEAQLKDPGVSRANEILRSCVHCGFCTATCPTYQVLGDELDSPRGRIYLIKDMLENERVPDAKTVASNWDYWRNRPQRQCWRGMRMICNRER